MGTEVLRPQDLFAEQFRVPQTPSFQRRRRFQATANLTLVVNRKPDNNSGYNNNKTSPRSDKKKFPVMKKSKNAAESRRKDGVINVGGLVNGQVTLLKRGESLDSIASKFKAGNPNPKSVSSKGKPMYDIAICDTGRIGPESPEMVPKQIRLPAPNKYAGSAITSPSPQAVPLPSFFNKRQQNGDLLLDDSATSDLRRLLRLD